MPTDVITRTESRGTGKYEQLLARCKGMTATPTAVAHPCDDASLGAVVEAARAGIIAPILVGPVERIRTVAKTCGLDIEQYEIEAVPHSHAAAARAVETVTTKIPSTIDAAALCKMADRGQIQGAILDGPLAFDNAISAEAARTKGISSAVAGDPDIVLVPDLEAGNMLAKNLTFLSRADAAGVVLGARVPIILTSRADNQRTRLASCGVAALYAAARWRSAIASPTAGPTTPRRASWTTACWRLSGDSCRSRRCTSPTTSTPSAPSRRASRARPRWPASTPRFTAGMRP